MANTYTGSNAGKAGLRVRESDGSPDVAGVSDIICTTADIQITDDGNGTITLSTGAGGGNTLDQAYDEGGAGAGRSITADSGAVEITGAGTDDMLVIESTDSLATAAPDVVLYRNSTTPATNDILGRVEFRGKDSGGADAAYATIEATIADATGGGEDGNIRFSTLRQGTETEYLAIGKINGSNREIIMNDGGADIDIRIESVGQTNSLFVQGSDGFIGVSAGTPTSTLHVGGSLTHATQATSTTTTLDATDYAVFATGGVMGITINLPTASGITGRVYFVKKVDADPGFITIDPSGMETIDGAPTVDLMAMNEARLIISDGTNWQVMSIVM